MTSYAAAVYAFYSNKPSPLTPDIDDCLALDTAELKAAGAVDVIRLAAGDPQLPAPTAGDARLLLRPEFRLRATFADLSSILVADAGWWVEVFGILARGSGDEMHAPRPGFTRLSWRERATRESASGVD
jgi:hypothetical protein